MTVDRSKYPPLPLPLPPPLEVEDAPTMTAEELREWEELARKRERSERWH